MDLHRTVDWGALLGCPGKKRFTLFHFEITLTSYEDIATRGGENVVPQTLCGQELALIVWNREGVSSYGKDR